METLAFLISIGTLVFVIIKFGSQSNAHQGLIIYIRLLEKRIKELELKIISNNNPVKEETPKAEPEETTTPIPETSTYIGHFEIKTEVVEVEELPLDSIPISNNEEVGATFLWASGETTQSKKVSEIVNNEITPIVPVPVIDTERLEKPISENANYQKNTIPAYQKPVTPPTPRKKNETWQKLEKQFAENWTGLLGSVIMVIGVGFLGIYAAVKVSAIGRFLLITGFAALLAGIFFYLHKKEGWLKLALWLRSSAGAIFLFACVGANGIPGLMWTDNGILTFLLLVLGILVNLFLGYIGGKQSFASLHVLLSLVSVIIIPLSPLTLIVGGIVTLFGIALSYREKWDYHLLFTISCFFAFHLFYWNSLHHVISQQERIIGIITILVIGLAVALVHYRRAYSTKMFDRVPFSVHLVNWFYFGMGLFLYSNGSRYSTFILAAGSVAAFLLARKAKKLEIRWLYLTDTLIAQLTALIALATLQRWDVDAATILAAIFVEGLLFLIIAQKENDSLLYKIGSVILNLTGFSLLIYSLVTIDYSNQTLIINHAISVLAASVLGIIYLVYSSRNNAMDVSGLFKPFGIPINDKTKHPILGFILGALFLSYHLHVYNFNWGVYTIVALLISILYLRNKLQSVELSFAAVTLLIGANIINWNQLDDHQLETPLLIVNLGLPILVASFFSVRWSFVTQLAKHINWLGVYLFAIQLSLLSYYLLYPASILAPGGMWLVLSLFAIITAKLISKSAKEFHSVDRYILHVGYGLIGLFLVRDIFVHLSIEEHWGALKGRIWIDLLAILIFAYWGITKKTESSEYKSWKYLHPLFLELILLFSISSIAIELNYTFLPLTWISLAIVTFVLGNWKHGAIGRLKVYSFGLFILSLFHELFLYNLSTNFSTNTLTYLDQPFQFACAFIVLSFSYLFFFYKRAVLQTIEWPYVLHPMKTITEVLYKSAAFIGIYLFCGFIMLLSYLMFAPVSSIIPGVIWLLLSVIVVTISISSQNKPSSFIGVDRYLLHIGYIFIASFLVRHFLVDIQLEGYVGPIKIRLLIEFLALAVFFYWATLKPKTKEYKSWDFLHPLFLELIVGFTVFIIALEVNAIWQPLIWMALSFIMVLLGNYKQWKLSRLVFYSLIIYWIAAFQTTFVTSSYIVPSPELINQPWVYGTASVLFQFVFLAFFYMKSSLENIELPESLLFLNKTIGLINKKKNVYIFYPLIICTGVFLFWSFDSSILTLLWVLECAIVFVISILLKEQHFRYIALGSLALCIIRLVFYDMAQASTLNRALVFLGVGIIMLGMNSVYNKYKNRFE